MLVKPTATYFLIVSHLNDIIAPPPGERHRSALGVFGETFFFAASRPEFMLW